MLLANSDLISQHPAQLYYSVLPFPPSGTYLAHQYPTPRGCISLLTGQENSWTPMLFMLSNDGSDSAAVAFAPSGHMLAVGCQDGIHIYNVSSGLLNSSIRTISSMDHIPHLAAFTKDEYGVVAVLSEQKWSDSKVSYQVEKFNLV